MKKYLFVIACLLCVMTPLAVFSGQYNEPGKGEGYFDLLDIYSVTPGNIPYRRPAGAGLGNSPLSTDGTDVVNAGGFTGLWAEFPIGTIDEFYATWAEIQVATSGEHYVRGPSGGDAFIELDADDMEDDDDRWRLYAADGGDVMLQTYASGSWVTVGTWSNAGGYTSATSLTVPTIYGSSASGGDVSIQSTSHATKGTVTLGGDVVGKATTNDGSTDALNLTDSDDAEVFAVNSNGDAEAQGFISGAIKVTNKSSGTSLTAAELNGIVRVTGTGTYILPATSTLAVGTWVTFKAYGVVTITIDPNASDALEDPDNQGVYQTAGVTAVSSGSAGDTITYLYDNTNQWTIYHRIGAWITGS
jgi:hypothetical protein